MLKAIKHNYDTIHAKLKSVCIDIGFVSHDKQMTSHCYLKIAKRFLQSKLNIFYV